MSWKGNLLRAGLDTDGANVQVFKGQFLVDDEAFDKAAPTTITNNSNQTYTVGALLGKLILRDPNGGARTDTTPTAAAIVAAIKGCRIGTSFEFVLRNTADQDETITLAGGTGVTISGTATVAQNNSKRWRAVVTAVATPAVTIYSEGTFVH
jgi:hypothetical protein